MERTAFVVVLVLLAAGTAGAQETEPTRGAISLQGGGSLIAPAGVELEYWLGPLGLSVETRLLVQKRETDWFGSLEPGFNLRYYFGDLEGGLFFFTGVGFLSLWRLSPFSLEQGIVKPRSGFGYNWLLGKEDRCRLGLEVGVAWLQEVIQGDLCDIQFPLVPHLLMALGRTF